MTTLRIEDLKVGERVQCRANDQSVWIDATVKHHVYNGKYVEVVADGSLGTYVFTSPLEGYLRRPISALQERDEARKERDALKVRAEAASRAYEKKRDEAHAKQYEMLTELRTALAHEKHWTWGGTVKLVMAMRHDLARTSLERDSAVRMRDAIQKDANTALEQRRAVESKCAEYKDALDLAWGRLDVIRKLVDPCCWAGNAGVVESVKAQLDVLEQTRRGLENARLRADIAEAKLTLAPGNYEGYLQGVTVENADPHVYSSWTGEVAHVRSLTPARVALDILIAPGTTRKVKFLLDTAAMQALNHILPRDEAAAEAAARNADLSRQLDLALTEKQKLSVERDQASQLVAKLAITLGLVTVSS